MVVINEIKEPKSTLLLNDEVVGEINGTLQFNDCLVQIFKSKLEGYSLLYEGVKYPILPNGRVKGAKNVYPTYSEQLKEILGF